MGRRSADPVANGHTPTLPRRRSDRFLAGLAAASRVTFVSHVHPDPDSLGSMMGLAHLVETCLDKPTRLTRDGLISRAENRVMVEVLGLNLVPIEGVTWEQNEAVVMVDSQPNTGRHTFQDTDVPLYAVIDHHDTPGDLEGVPFLDVRRGLGATCSIATSYLMEQEVALPTKIATGLLYGIETELCGYPREASPLDDGTLLFLYPLADKDMLARIRNARLPHGYFECLLQALQSSFIYDRLLISWVNDLEQPELAAGVVDLMIRFEEVDWAVCAGVYEDRLVLSVRTTHPQGRAGEILNRVVGKLGRAGGHHRRAGGVIYLPSTAPAPWRTPRRNSAAGSSKPCTSMSAVAIGWSPSAKCFITFRRDNSMSEIHDPHPPTPPEMGGPPPLVLPVRYAQRPAASGWGTILRTFFLFALAGSIGLNVVFLVFGFPGGGLGASSSSIHEHFHSGKASSPNKIAIINLDGVIMEGQNGFVRRQIDQAAHDKNVKAVVLRIVSPGGSITASDDLHRRLKQLAEGKRPKQEGGQKPIVVSMGAMAASGGYYVAMPAQYLIAEPTTITGSIGVYAAFPNIAKLAEEKGFGMNVIKAGEVKDSGSMFHHMTPQERQLWQDMVDHAFDQFLQVVENGRPNLKGKMREVVIRKTIPATEAAPFRELFGAQQPKTVEYVRRRADGGIFTADEAKKLGLIDAIGYEEDATTKAAAVAELGDDYKVISYDRPDSLANLLFGVKASPPASALDANRWADAACPRLWYLSSQSELSGILSIVGRRE